MGDFFEEIERVGPNIERISNIDGSVYERIMHPDGHIEMRNIRPSYFSPVYSSGEAISATATTRHWSMKDYADLRKYFESEEKNKVNVIRKESYNSGEHIVACYDEKDLSVENILKTLSAIKGKLMIDIAPIHVKKIECSITPQVRQNIVAASKKLKMYGKKRPIIARFDEYGNRLPDEIDIGTTQGITLKIIDPGKYGKYYIELKGVEFPRIVEPKTYVDDFSDTYLSAVDSDDLPF